jgi:hypothetical protein
MESAYFKCRLKRFYPLSAGEESVSGPRRHLIALPWPQKRISGGTGGLDFQPIAFRRVSHTSVVIVCEKKRVLFVLALIDVR